MQFDLDFALASWLQTLKHRRTFYADDLEELERHVRDHVAILTASGRTEEDAFQEAIRGVGDYGSIEREYKKVFWGKVRMKKKAVSEFSWRISMLRSYFTISVRNLVKNKGYTLINLGSLTLGITVAIFILLYVDYEWRFDSFHDQADRIGRVLIERPNHSGRFPITPTPVASTLARDLPEVETAVAFRPLHDGVLSSVNGQFLAEGLYAEAAFFQLFSFAMMQGQPHTALAIPDAIVLTESMALKLFGEDNPMGRRLQVDNQTEFTVSGVVEDIPDQSHFAFDFVIPAAAHSRYQSRLDDWRRSEWYTYFSLSKGSSFDQVDAKLGAIVEQFAAPFYQNDSLPSYTTQPLKAIHLNADVERDIAPQNDAKYIYLLLTIGALILIIAGFNYTNLATARSMQRAREIGVRKVIGARRGQLVMQFLGESMLLSLVSLGLAFGLSFILLPEFNSFVERQIAWQAPGTLIWAILGIVVMVGLLAGCYPALVASGWHPIRALAGRPAHSQGKGYGRNLLVIGQFAVGIVLVISSLVVRHQLDYIQAKKLGYDRNQVVAVPVRDDGLKGEIESVKTALLSNPHVLEVANSKDVPTDIRSSDLVKDWEGMIDEGPLSMSFTRVGFDYVELYSLELVEGRSFSRELDEQDEMVFLLNEAARARIGWEEATGKRFRMSGYSGTIVGVVKDFHFKTLHESIEPLVLLLDPDRVDVLSIKAASGSLRESLAFLEQTMREVSPAYPFEYYFLNEAFDQLYRTEKKLGELFDLFTFVALFITALGLYGLAAFSTAQRTKEIGVRKVLGATVPRVMMLIAKDFVKLVVLAFVIAAPIAYLSMNRWLQDFAYRIDIGEGVFVLAGGLALGIALLTISYQTIKAAVADPVKALRYD